MITEFEWPSCAKCGHGIDKIERRQDFFTGALVYTAYCHGERQTQVVAEIDLHDAIMIWTTSAFDEKPISSYPSVTYVQK